MFVRASILCFALLSPIVSTACGDDDLTPRDASDGTADVSFDDNFVPDSSADTHSDATTLDAEVASDATKSDALDADGDVLTDATIVDATSDAGGDIDATATDTETDATTDSVGETDATASDVSDADVAADTTIGDSAGPDSDTTSACDRNGYTSVAGDALKFDNGDLYYLAQSTLGVPVDVLAIEIYAALGGAQAPGSYPITADNYDSCGNCVLIQTACDANLNHCERTFLANAGTLDVSAVGDIGDAFTATLTDLELVEVTYDDDYHSTVVPGGQTWCVDRYEIDVVLQ